MDLFGLKKKKTDAIRGDDREFLQRVMDRFRVISEAEKEQRAAELEDLEFCDPDGQWPDRLRKQRESRNKACLTIDRISPIVQQICNEQRQNRPAVKVSAVDDGGDIETARVLQGIIRNIEYSSDADTAYDTAEEACVRCGRGFFRIITRYAGDDTFEQEIAFLRIPNHHTVYFDPNCVQSDYSDAMDCFIVSDITREEFEDLYPNSKIVGESRNVWQSLGDSNKDWFSSGGEMVRVAEYFYRDKRKSELVEHIPDGKPYLLEDLTRMYQGQIPEGVLGRSRPVEVPTIKWCKLTGAEVLEKADWPGRWIPVVPVLGKELIVDGKRRYFGVIRQARDAQRLHNYMVSKQAETIALAPAAPWVGPVGFPGGRRREWAEANLGDQAFLEYEVVNVAGEVMPPPRRDVQEPAIGAISQSVAGTVDAIHAVTNMYSPSLGDREANQSGRAIMALQNQGNTANYHFQDGLSRAIRHAGRILVDLIPKIYDTERVIRIVKEDETTDTVQIGASPDIDLVGIKKIYDIKTGRYDVTVSSGPSYQNKRQESLAFLLDFAKIVPAVAQVAPDLIASQSDSVIADELAKRLKATLPPQFQEKSKEGFDPAQAQQMLAQQGQMIEQLSAELQAATAEFDREKLKLDFEKYKVELQEKTKVEIELAKLGSAEAQFVMKQDLLQINADADRSQAQYESSSNRSGMAGGSPAGPEGAQPPNAGIPAGME